MDKCSRIVKNGKSCEKEAGHKGRCTNSWCAFCGERLRYSNAPRCLICAPYNPVKRAAALHRSRRGEGRTGLLGRMRHLVQLSKMNARKGGFLPVAATPEELVTAWQAQQGHCAWSGRTITLLQSKVEHNHITGEFRGFVHSSLNLAEGLLSKLSPYDQVKFIEVTMPEAVSLLRKRTV